MQDAKMQATRARSSASGQFWFWIFHHRHSFYVHTSFFTCPLKMLMRTSLERIALKVLKYGEASVGILFQAKSKPRTNGKKRRGWKIIDVDEGMMWVSFCLDKRASRGNLAIISVCTYGALCKMLLYVLLAIILIFAWTIKYLSVLPHLKRTRILWLRSQGEMSDGGGYGFSFQIGSQMSSGRPKRSIKAPNRLTVSSFSNVKDYDKKQSASTENKSNELNLPKHLLKEDWAIKSKWMNTNTRVNMCRVDYE